MRRGLLTILFLLVCLIGQPLTVQASSAVMYSLPTDDKVVALTFDDGPTPYEQDILNTLQQEKIQAAFFWIGNQANPEQAKQILAEGSFIENHSDTHPDFSGWSYNSILSNLDAAQSKITKDAGTSPIYFRPPYGYVNKNLLQAAEVEGLQVINWNVDSRDWENPHNPDAIKQNVYSEVANGSVILFHEKAITAQILPEIIEHLKEMGYTFASLPGLKPPVQKIHLEVHGQLLNVQGVLQNNITLVPVRAVFEELGVHITWHKDATMDLEANNRFVHLQLNDPDYSVTQLHFNSYTGQPGSVASSVYETVSSAVYGSLPTAPYLDHDTAFVPLRVLAEALGFKVVWEQDHVRLE